MNNNDQEFENALQKQEKQEIIIIENENQFEFDDDYDDDEYQDEFIIEENRTNFNYIGSFSGLIGLNTGVYVLHNTYYNKYYVGQSINLQVRMISHYNNLNRNKSRNEELQRDINLMKEKGLDPFKYMEGQLIFKQYYERVNSVDQINQIQNDLINRESEEIARLIEKGMSVYNLSGLNGIPCIVSGKFYPSISKVRKTTGESFERVKANLRDKEKSNYLVARKKDLKRLGEDGANFSTLPQSIIFSDPISKSEIGFKTIKDADKFFKNQPQEIKEKYKKMNVVITRKWISIKLKEGNNPYYRYA